MPCMASTSMDSTSTMTVVRIDQRLRMFILHLGNTWYTLEYPCLLFILDLDLLDLDLLAPPCKLTCLPSYSCKLLCASHKHDILHP